MESSGSWDLTWRCNIRITIRVLSSASASSNEHPSPMDHHLQKSCPRGGIIRFTRIMRFNIQINITALRITLESCESHQNAHIKNVVLRIQDPQISLRLLRNNIASLGAGLGPKQLYIRLPPLGEHGWSLGPSDSSPILANEVKFDDQNLSRGISHLQKKCTM